ncbi:MAG: hypothetical protein D5S00_06205 [Tindallia sp. MSAO_Bac2]|nr:MAG: hypothetical protein D5S00_06205 [Tindallia sp. MSAO_Bac2]
MNKLLRWLFSLHLGVVLFVIISIYAVLSTLLPQGLPVEHYLQEYNFGAVIIAFGLHNAYSSWIFRLLMFLLIINLTGCTAKLIPSQLKRYKESFTPALKQNAENLWKDGMSVNQIKQTLATKGFKWSEKDGDLWGVKHRIGIFGSTVTHIGIIIIVLGSFVGNYFAHEGFFNLMPGERATFHDQNFSVLLKDFYIEFRDDNSVDQYYSELNVLQNGDIIKEETIWVNRPMSHEGIQFYQSSYGWASRLRITDTEGNEVMNRFLRNDESVFFEPAHLTIHLFGYFPDFTMGHNNMPVTRSERQVNPHYAVVLYHFGEFADSFIINPDQSFTFQGYEIEFSDSVLYTGLIYRRDYGYYFVLLGCILLMAGLFMAFYTYPKYILLRKGELYAITRQNAWGFTMWLKRQFNL